MQIDKLVAQFQRLLNLENAEQTKSASTPEGLGSIDAHKNLLK